MKEIKKICKKYNIENYTINEYGSIDIDDNVNLYDKGLTELPLKFGKVSGYFDCSNNKLKSLSGAPREVSGDFFCHFNNLMSLEGAPEKVGGDFYCYDNQLLSLEGSPNKVGGVFLCRGNLLTDLEGGPEKVGGYFRCYGNKLTSLSGAPLDVGDFICDLFSHSDYLSYVKQINRNKKLEQLGI
jgi:hypothetical protein